MRFAPTVITALCAFACATATAADARTLPDAAKLKSMEARFAPVEVRVDVSDLPAEERVALVRLIEASQYIDALFMRQRWPGNESTLLQLLADETPAGRARLSYFMLNKGPWSELDEDQVFVPGAATKPPGGNFYPAGATREEVDAWMKSLTGAQHAAATGFFTTIRRTPDGKLTAVPYSLEYQGELAEMARLLREAAASTRQPTLKSFLEKRADAFVSNDYYASDVAWMELDASIEPTIGPYEVYEDEWFNFKAAFESFIALNDRAETDQARALQQRAAGPGESPADRSAVPPQQARRLLADPRRQRRVRGRRRQPWRADRRVQFAERRARRRREGLQARAAEEFPAGEVRAGAGADLEAGARCERPERRGASTRSSRTS